MIKKFKAKNIIYLLITILIISILSGCTTKSINSNKEVSTAIKK